MTRMTTEDLDVLIAEHTKVEEPCGRSYEVGGWVDLYACSCDEWWPCATYLLASEVRAAREEHRLTSEFLSGLAKADCLPMGVGDIQEMGYRLEQDIWVLAHYEEGRTT